MPITFDCACGKTLRVPDQHAGKRVRCPACTGVATVPEPEPMFEVVEESNEPMFEVVEKAPPRARPVAKPTVSRDDDDDEDDRRGYGTSKSSRDEDDADEERPKPKKKKPKWKKRAAAQENQGRSLEGRVVNGGVAGGLLAMLIAIVWFVVGLVALDRIFIYPPILFVLGLVAFFKGLAGDE